jgi:predicted metal-binding membrane protein
MLARAPSISLFGSLLAGLIGLAWLALVVWGSSPYGRYLDDKNLDAIRIEGGGTLLVFVLGWVLMTVAMMLPTSLPSVTLFRGMVHRRAERARLLSPLLLGYLGVWTVFGLVVHNGDAALHSLVASQPWLAEHAALIGTATLLLAGVYQFTPLKYHCLERCRSPLAFVVARWQGRLPAGEAFQLGVAHGLFCVGCCWSLMLLMFAVGVGSLGWMFALATVMAVEKNLSSGRRLSGPLGLLLIASAGFEWAGLYACCPRSGPSQRNEGRDAQFGDSWQAEARRRG